MKDFLSKVGIMNDDEKVSITNLIVFVFTGILAFKMLFTGVTIDTKLFDWKVEAPDIANTLPLLFSLMNYGHRRYQQNNVSASGETYTKEETK